MTILMDKPEIQDTSKQHILMIAYFFPPIGGSGALRPMKLAKYLPEFGWLPVILSAKNPDWYYATDPDLLAELPDSVKIYRSAMIRSAWVYRIINPFRIKKMDKWIKQWLLHPDPQIGWLPSAVSYGIRLVKKYKIKAIYSTSAPLTSHLIAYLIKKKTGLPWVADFRDEWFENPDINYPTNFHRRVHFKLEKMIVNSADRVITAAPGFCRLLSKHSGCEKKCSTIFMGFDPAEFKKPVINEQSHKENQTFSIAFSGLFYASFRPARVVSAIQSLIDSGKIQKERIRLLFVGANTPEDIGSLDRYGICHFTGFISHKAALAHIKKSDALLLLLSRERGEFVIPSKTFEYIATGKPILGVVPEKSDVASIISRTQTGIVIDFNDEAGMKAAVYRLYNAWAKKRILFTPDQREIMAYSQKRQTGRFVELLDCFSGDNKSLSGAP